MNEQSPSMGRLSRFLRGAPKEEADVATDAAEIGTPETALHEVGRIQDPVLPITQEVPEPEKPVDAREQVEGALAIETVVASTPTVADASQPGADDVDTHAVTAPVDATSDADAIRIPTEPMTDRADIYRLIMAIRRRDPRSSTEIMADIGAFDNQCTSMLNRGVPPTDAALVGVAAHYGIPTSIEMRRRRDMSHYVGLAKADVIGPEPLSREEARMRAVDGAHGKIDEHGKRVGGTSYVTKAAIKATQKAMQKTEPPADPIVSVATPAIAEAVGQDMVSFLETASRLAGRITSAEARAEAAEAARDEAIARADQAERREAASARTLAELRAVLGGVPAAATSTEPKKPGRVGRRHELGQKHADVVVERMRGDILMAVGNGATWDQILTKLDRKASPYMMRARNLLLKTGVLIDHKGVYTPA